MKYVALLIVATVMVVASNAQARNDGRENGAGCVNNCGNQQQEVPNGNGGRGGAGGEASSSAVGRADAAANASARSASIAAQGQKQAQLQGQLQAQSVDAANRNVNDVANRNVNGVDNANDNSNKSSVTVNNTDSSTYDTSDTYSEYVAPAVVPPLAATGDCMGSASAAGSNSVMGFAFGKTYIDENCNARRDSIHLSELAKLYGANDLATASVMRLCSQPEMAKVIAACPKVEPATADGRWWAE